MLTIQLDSIKINSLCESVIKVNRKHCLLKICHLIYENEAYKFPKTKRSACISLNRKNETEESPIVAKMFNYN